MFPEKFERRDSLDGKVILILVCGSMLGIMALISAASHMYNLNGIKSKTVGDGQYGAARFATGQELARTFRKIPYTPQRWRRLGNKCTELKLPQGIVVGCQTKYKILRDRNSRKRWPFRLRKDTYALVDTGDVHTMMIGAAGCGKTAFWLYPNLEYACAAGMSFLTTDTKGDLYRNYVNICKAYGFSTSVIDLRNPTKSDSFNLLHLVNKYTDLYKKDASLAHKAKAEKYAKIIAKTLIFTEGDNRVMFYCDEFGSLPPISSAEVMYSASRSRKLSIVSIIQSYQQLEKNYGKEGAAIIQDNCQLTIAGGFAPTSETADIISKALGSRTVMTGSVSRGHENASQSLQMTERPLMSADELKSMKPGSFIVMKTGSHPFISRLKLFTQWGIEFDMGKCELTDKAAREVHYAGKDSIVEAVDKKYPMEQESITVISEEDIPIEEVAKNTDSQLQHKINKHGIQKTETQNTSAAETPLTVPTQYRSENQSRKQMCEHQKVQRRYSYKENVKFPSCRWIV